MNSSTHSSGFSVYPPGIWWEASDTRKPDNMRSVQKRDCKVVSKEAELERILSLQAEQEQEGERQLLRTSLGGTQARSPKTILQGAALCPIHQILSLPHAVS